MLRDSDGLLRGGLVCLAFWLGGCALDAPPSEAPTEETGVVRFVSNSAYSAWTTSEITADLGEVNGRVCWLSGLAGDVFPSLGTTTVEIEDDSPNFQLHIKTGSGLHVKAWARCAPAIATASVSISDGDPPKIIAPVESNRRCFLTGFTTGNGQREMGLFGTPEDRLETTHNADNWFLSAHAAQGSFTATARCVDGSGDLGQYTGTGIDGGLTDTLLTQVSGGNCGLQRLEGWFNDDDFYEGAYIERDVTSNDLELTVYDDSRTAVAGCLQ